MICITDRLSLLTGGAFAACGFDRDFGKAAVSARSDLGQYQCIGAFEAAKKTGGSPMEIARRVSAAAEKDGIIEKIEAVSPGYINITLRDEFLMCYAGEIAADAHIGLPQTVRPETILIDYGNPNVAKPLHVGHLRSAVLGESLKRLAGALGHRVIGDVHIGDYGLPMGLVIAGLEERGEGPENMTADKLCELYPRASKKSGEDPAFLKRAQDITAALQEGDPAYRHIWKRMVELSVEDMKNNYRKLGVLFDRWYGESDSENYLPELIRTLQSNGLLTESEGAKIVSVSECGDNEPVPPVMIQKTDGAFSYAATDLATVIQRCRLFQPNRMWYVVDKRQRLHFLQVFRCAKKAGLIPSGTELEHLWFGTMNGRDGRPFKTRDGDVMRLSELLDMASAAAAEKVERSGRYTEALQKQEVSEKVAVAAVKFGDLSTHRTKDGVFDLEKYLAADGKTGVYLLYTVARIRSILKKTEVAQWPDANTGPVTDAERGLLLEIVRSGEDAVRAFDDRAPSILCERAYRIASAFSRFYHETHILSEKNADVKNRRTALCSLTERILVKLLDMLGIEPVDAM